LLSDRREKKELDAKDFFIQIVEKLQDSRSSPSLQTRAAASKTGKTRGEKKAQNNHRGAERSSVIKFMY
jgi:hypothetical protein